MIKKVLFTVLVIVLLAGIVGCGPAQSQPEYTFERNDLIMVNITTTVAGFGSTGVYVFFFENYPTTKAVSTQVRIKFDTRVEKPVVRAKEITNRTMLGEVIKGVTVTFKDKEQMKEYWIVK